MRAALSVSIAAGVLLAFSSTASADVPAYADLPSGHPTAPPETKPPSSIPASEKLPGFLVAPPQFPKRFNRGKKGGAPPPPPSYVFVVGSTEHAKRIAEGDFSDRHTTESDACFTQARRFDGAPRKRMPALDEEDGEETTETPPIPDWNEGLGGTATVQLKTENNPNGGVTAVHSERLVRDGDSVRLEIVDAWVDPVTKGVRKIGASTLPLKLVGSSRGLEVYAARDAREGVKAVQFVVVPPKEQPGGGGPESLVATHHDGRNASSSSCSHLRLAIAADDGAAESVVLKATLRLPDRGDSERSEEEEKTARVREAAIHLGVSKTKRDRAPVVSLTFGWSGRETTQTMRSEPPEG